MQSRIVDLIGRVTDDELTAELLRINDELNNLFLRHQRYEKNRASHTGVTSPSAVLGAAIGIPPPTNSVPTAAAAAAESPKLLDFPDSNKDDLLNSFSRLGNFIKEYIVLQIELLLLNDLFSIGVSNTTKPTAKDADEFDMLAQSRTNGTK